MPQQHLRQEAVLERDQAVVARVAGRELRDARHRVAVMVAAGDHARPARRAQRRRVHVAVAQPIVREAIQVRRRDRAAEAAELAEAGVVEHDEQHVRSTLRRPHQGRPRRCRFISRPADHAGEGGARRVLVQRHLDTPWSRDRCREHLGDGRPTHHPHQMICESIPRPWGRSRSGRISAARTATDSASAVASRQKRHSAHGRAVGSAVRGTRCSLQANARAPLDVRGVPRCVESGAEIILPG